MGDQATNNNIKHRKKKDNANVIFIINRQEEKLHQEVVGFQVPNKVGLTSHCHGGFIITRGEYSIKGEKTRKEMEGRNDSGRLFLLLLAFVFYKKLYSFGISMCLFLFFFSSSFIGAKQ